MGERNNKLKDQKCRDQKGSNNKLFWAITNSKTKSNNKLKDQKQQQTQRPKATTNSKTKTVGETTNSKTKSVWTKRAATINYFATNFCESKIDTNA